MNMKHILSIAVVARTWEKQRKNMTKYFTIMLIKKKD